MNAAPKRLCSNEFFEGVLEDLGGLAPEEQALVAADLAAQVHQLVAQRGGFLELTDDDWADGFALKLFGAVRLTRAAWSHLKASRGSVVNISGAGGRTPGAEFSIGGSVNAAMHSFTKATAELGIADGVQVNVINPGLIRTGRFQKRLDALAAEKNTDLATAERQMVAGTKTTRVGEPEDIAALVAFIAGPEGRFLQGSMIDMDGGATKTL